MAAGPREHAQQLRVDRELGGNARRVWKHAQQLHSDRQLGRLLRWRGVLWLHAEQLHADGNSALYAAGVPRHAQQLHRLFQHGTYGRTTTTTRLPTVGKQFIKLLNYCCTTPMPPEGGQYHRRSPIGQRDLLERQFPLSWGGQRRVCVRHDIDGEPWATPPSMAATSTMRPGSQVHWR